MAAREVMDRIGVGQHYTNEVVEKAAASATTSASRGRPSPTPSRGSRRTSWRTPGAVRLPLDEPGADIRLVTPSADFFAEPHVDGLIGYAKVFHRAGFAGP